jgi:hypothetical protein
LYNYTYELLTTTEDILSAKWGLPYLSEGISYAKWGLPYPSEGILSAKYGNYSLYLGFLSEKRILSDLEIGIFCFGIVLKRKTPHRCFGAGHIR